MAVGERRCRQPRGLHLHLPKRLVIEPDCHETVQNEACPFRTLDHPAPKALHRHPPRPEGLIARFLGLKTLNNRVLGSGTQDLIEEVLRCLGQGSKDLQGRALGFGLEGPQFAASALQLSPASSQRRSVGVHLVLRSERLAKSMMLFRSHNPGAPNSPK